ncbi:MAG: hypothetical protein M4579_007028 [Chaenotheca gracillima]|nr:MAG: hypothetical protein M4579_007028 [Chaenotheca gracillima]
MRTSRVFSLLSTFLLLISFTSAWPWPIDSLIVRRADGASSTGSEAPSTKNAAKTKPPPKKAASTGSITAKPTRSASGSASETGSGSGTESGKGTGKGKGTSASKTASGSASGSGSKTGSGSGTSGSAAQTTPSINPAAGAGGVQMITPAAIAGAQYYKIGDNVTFAWNYTSLTVTPSKIDIYASCSDANTAFPIATNQSVKATGNVTWDTGAWQATATRQLLMATYTLLIYDSSKDVTDTPQAGHLGSANQFNFGMYIPREPTPLKDFHCPSCNSALSDSERHALGFMAIMATVTVLSFTWFVGGVGVIF